MSYRYIIGTELLNEEQVKVYLSFLSKSKQLSLEEINKEAIAHFSKSGHVMYNPKLVKGLTVVK